GALALHAAVSGGPALPVIGALSLGWSALAVTGVIFPRLEMYGRVVSRRPARSAGVGLAWAAGPHPVTTRRVLEALAPTRHRATFFVLGEKARRHPGMIREIHTAGHALALHRDSHASLHSVPPPRSARDQIARAAASVETVTGAQPRFFRPPFG